MQDIIYYDNGLTAAFNGYTFRKDKKTGYFLSSRRIGQARKRLHVFVWETYKGDVGEGYEIHHIDHNKDNNNIDNLERLTSEEHHKRHADEMTESYREKLRKNLMENAQPKAIKWHKSEKGKDWHKEHYEMMKDKLYQKKEFVCANCGETFFGIDNGNTRFCSNKCKSAFRRKSGVDNIERKCEYCGQPFVTNKYSQAKYCEIRRCKNSRNRDL
jgi:rubrerythrin